MLDFYLINDEQPKPRYPEQIDLEFVGDLNNKTFETLKTKGLIENRFDYYSDFRWNSAFVKQIYSSMLANEFRNDSDIQQLFELISKANEINYGLIAYCD